MAIYSLGEERSVFGFLYQGPPTLIAGSRGSHTEGAGIGFLFMALPLCPIHHYYWSRWHALGPKGKSISSETAYRLLPSILRVLFLALATNDPSTSLSPTIIPCDLNIAPKSPLFVLIVVSMDSP